MDNRLKHIETTKAYAKAFNDCDIPELRELITENEAVFSRQGQPTIIGRENILRRTRKLFKRLERMGQKLHMVNAIIDIKDDKARPCLIGVLDGERFSVVVLDCKPNGLVKTIAIILSQSMVQSARPTEPLTCDEKSREETLNSLNPTFQELEERRKGLRVKEHKLKQRIAKEGNTPMLAGKMMRLENEKEKLQYLIRQYQKSH